MDRRHSAPALLIALSRDLGHPAAARPAPGLDMRGVPSPASAPRPPPGLEAFGPPPGWGAPVLEPMNIPAPKWAPPLDGTAGGSWCGPACRDTMLPAWITPAFLGGKLVSRFRHHMPMLQTVEERLKAEVADASRLLGELAGNPPEPPAGAGVPRHLENSPLRAQLEELSRDLRDAGGLGWEGLALAKKAAQGAVLLEAIAAGGPTQKRAVQNAMHGSHNVLVLACSLHLSPTEFDSLGSQGLCALKPPLMSLLTEAFEEGGYDSVDAVAHIITRCGTAKYHLFNEGTNFSRRPPRTRDLHRAAGAARHGASDRGAALDSVAPPQPARAG